MDGLKTCNLTAKLVNVILVFYTHINFFFLIFEEDPYILRYEINPKVGQEW